MSQNTHVMVRDRRQGKTTEAIRQAIENPTSILVVPEEGRRNHVLHQAPELKGRVFTLDNLGDALRGRIQVSIIVDDAEAIFHRFFAGHNIELMTLTGWSV